MVLKRKHYHNQSWQYPIYIYRMKLASLFEAHYIFSLAMALLNKSFIALFSMLSYYQE